MRMRHSAGLALAALGLAAVLAGCEPQAEEAGSPVTKAHKALSPDAAKLAANMVAAVSAGEKAPVEVKFELAQRPEVGKPTDISLVFIPVGPLDRLSARFAGVEGIEVVKGGETEQFARPVVGAPITHVITVVARRDGIFSVQAVVLMDSETESLSRSYSIPLIAGSGIAEWSPKVAARGDDAG